MNKIQSNELRVGNVLLYKVHDELAEPKTQWVMHRIDHEDIALCHHSNEYFNDHYKAVELTKDLLLNTCGFKVRNAYECKEYYIAHDEMEREWIFSMKWYKNAQELGLPNVPFYRGYKHSIHNLHQLQNIFFPLNNFQELPINLEP